MTGPQLNNGTLSEASVHGRFQPLHLGHLRYLMTAFDCSLFLWIGLTQFQVENLGLIRADPHRSRPENNPLTYFERCSVLLKTLDHHGIDRSRYCIIPFPIENRDQLTHFLPIDIPILTTVCEPWNLAKIELLREVGYEVRVLYDNREKEYEGVAVRQSIIAGDGAWKEMVPGPVVDAIEEYEIADRLQQLSAGA